MNIKSATIPTSVLVASTLLLAGCGSEGGDAGDSIELRYQTLAFQPELVEANERIVQEWNDENPEVQIELVQGDWGSVHDQLTASFEGGTAPDIFHYDTGRIRDFADRGNLLDIGEYVSDETHSDISGQAWETVSFPTLEGTWGIPHLQELWAVFANSDALTEAGIEAPTVDDPWTWEEYAEVSSDLTVDDGDKIYGGAVPLGNPASRILPLAPAYGAEFFSENNGQIEGVFGNEEKELIVRINEMLNVEETITPDLRTEGPSGSVPGFVRGDYRTLVAPIHLRQALSEADPEFDWEMLPPLVGDSPTQGTDTQGFFVASQTEHPEEAVDFMEFLANASNQVDLAKGDMLLPTSTGALDELQNDEDPSWPIAVSAAEQLEIQPYQRIEGSQEWIERVGTPALEEYFSQTINMDELESMILNEGNSILDRYSE